jgi:hypothetical protein
MRPPSTISDWAGVLAKTLSLPVFSPASTSLPATVCERGMTRPASGSHSRPGHHVFLDQRELFLDLPADELTARSEGLAGGNLALDLLHPGLVAGADNLEAANAGVVAHLLEEIDRILRRPDRQIVVAGGVAEVGGMRRRADIGRHA